jgi:hypothetical protein
MALVAPVAQGVERALAHEADRNETALRVADGLNELQEDALVGLMWEEFGRSKGNKLEHDKVKRFALQIQADPQVCAALDAQPVAPSAAWMPSDAWISDMTRAFKNARAEEKKKERDMAFGGPRERDYDPKNPFGGRGGAPAKPKKATTASVRAAPSTRPKSGRSKPSTSRSRRQRSPSPKPPASAVA